MRVNPKLLYVCNRWSAYLKGGGEPEAARKAWLQHYVARKRYDDAMALVVSKVNIYIYIFIYVYVYILYMYAFIYRGGKEGLAATLRSAEAV